MYLHHHFQSADLHQAWQDQLCGSRGERDDEEDEERGENLGGGEQHQQEPHGNFTELTIVVKIIINNYLYLCVSERASWQPQIVVVFTIVLKIIRFYIESLNFFVLLTPSFDPKNQIL